MNCSCVLVSVLWATPQWLLHKPENWRIDVSADEAAKFGCNEFRFRLNTSVTIVAIVCLNVILLCVCFRPAKYPPPPHCTGVESNTCLDVIHGRGLLLLHNKSMVPDPVVLGSQDLPSMFRRLVAWTASSWVWRWSSVWTSWCWTTIILLLTPCSSRIYALREAGHMTAFGTLYCTEAI